MKSEGKFDRAFEGEWYLQIRSFQLQTAHDYYLIKVLF